jgi:hypothetical protein
MKENNPMKPQFFALAETSIVNTDGKTRTLDDILDEADNRDTVLRFTNKGTFAPSHILDVTPDDEAEGIKVVTVTLFSGEEFTLLEGTLILASDNNWVNISDKKPGDGIKTLTYNPSVRHPQLTPKVISKVEAKTLAFAPVVSFDISPADNFLLSVSTDESISLLVPICPKQL